MKISRSLNLVVPIEREDVTYYVHSMPLSEPVFDTYWRVLAAAHAAIFREGLSTISGPRVATRMLRDIAIDRGVWEGPAGVQVGFMAELRRISSVIAPTEAGWTTMPLQDAIAREILDTEEAREVEAYLVFFYACLSVEQAVSGSGDVASGGRPLGLCDYIVQLYGIRRLAADIDAGRQFWREPDGGIIGAVLGWVSDEGFEPYFGTHGLDYRDALEFRQRHLTAAINRRRW